MTIYVKLLIVVLVTALFTFIANTCFAQDYTKQGNTYAQSEKTVSSNDIKTIFFWKDRKGVEYPLYIHKYTKGDNAGKYTAFVFKTSEKTGKEYKYYIPEGMAIAEDIIKNKPEYAI